MSSAVTISPRHEMPPPISCPFTPAQMRVIQHLAAGKQDKEIAELLHNSLHTVKAHRAQIFARIRESFPGVTNVAGLVALCFRQGWLA